MFVPVNADGTLLDGSPGERRPEDLRWWGFRWRNLAQLSLFAEVKTVSESHSTASGPPTRGESSLEPFSPWLRVKAPSAIPRGTGGRLEKQAPRSTLLDGSPGEKWQAICPVPASLAGAKRRLEKFVH